MAQVWKNWLWKLFLVVTIATTMLFSGNDALADNFTKLIPEQMGAISKTGIQQPTVLALLGESQLRLKSITLNNTSTEPGLIYIRIKENGKTIGPIAIEPGQQLPITLNSCFSNLVTVLLKDDNTDFIGEKTISAANSTTKPLPPLDYGSYKINYEVNVPSCP